jgi:hypothetical protein
VVAYLQTCHPIKRLPSGALGRGSPFDDEDENEAIRANYFKLTSRYAVSDRQLRGIA